jgi:hypothetical protein
MPLKYQQRRMTALPDAVCSERMSFDRERFMSTTYGYSTSEWESARDWTRRRLQAIARARTTITYSDFHLDLDVTS